MSSVFTPLTSLLDGLSHPAVWAITVGSAWLYGRWSAQPITPKPTLTNYQKVVQFNKVFGIPVNDRPVLDIFDLDPKLVEYRMSLIREEVTELEAAVATKDMVETVDALSDILYVVYGMGATLGLNLDQGMGLVHDSNMTKLCTSEEEAKRTVESYKGDDRYDSPDYRRSDDGRYWVVFNRSTKKILKSINYRPVSFNTFLSN